MLVEQDIGMELIRVLSREKITGSDQLTELKPDFYIQIMKFLEDIKENEREKMILYLHDLLNIRLWKILNITKSTNIAPEFEQKLTIEEKRLFNSIYKAINEFKDSVLPNF